MEAAEGREAFYNDDYDRDEEPDGQLLLEIIRKEEDRDLRELVKRFRDQCRHHLGASKTELLGWSEPQDRSVIDYLQDVKKVALFVSPLQQTGDRLRFDNAVVGSIHVSRPTCFFIKVQNDGQPLIRPSQYDKAIYQACLNHGAADLAHHLAKLAFYFEKQTLHLCENRLKEYKHLMESNLMKLRYFLIEPKCLNEAILLKPTLILQPTNLDEDDEDYIDKQERLAHQWVYVIVYCLELRDYYPTTGSKKSQPTIQDEINSLVQKYEILRKLGNKLMKEDYQRVLLTLKQANSAVGDELQNLIVQLHEDGKQTKLAAKYLTCLRRSVENMEKVKIFPDSIRGQQIVPLSDLPVIYQDACNRIIVIVRHVPIYEDREHQVATRLLFTIGNEVVAKVSQHALEVAVDQLFLKGRPHHCVEDLEKICRRCVNRCVATYVQTMRWQKFELDDDAVLANFKALDLRIGHMIDICESLEQLGSYGDGVKTSTFSNERERDIGKSLNKTQDTFVELAITLVSRHRDILFDIHQSDEWYRSYNRFLNETRTLEIRLVHDLEEAVSRCRTLWSIYEVLMAFKHLYCRPLFTAVINSTANQLFKKASREAKVACGISSGDPWSTPISATLTTHSTRLAASAQRARGYVDKIAKLVQMTSWAGSPSYREKALVRCQQAHRLLGDAIKREFTEWIDKLQLELTFNTNTALQKFAVRRHFQRPDWIQSNLDGVVFQVIQAAESWDRLLMELPAQVMSLWNERNELRNVHGSVCAMSYYYNYIVQELDKKENDVRRNALAKLEKAVQPCLNQITWKQLIGVKRVVTSCYFAMEEVVQDLKPILEIPPPKIG